jgi:predicted Zn-dependent peptidase
MGAQTIHRGDQDIHKLTVANKLLGGFFGSRLMKKLREEKGLTYGVYSSITHAQNASYWTISTEMKSDNAEDSLEAIHEIITELAQNYPSLSEVDMLKNFLKGKFLSSMNSILDVASIYTLLFVNDISHHFLTTSLETIDNIRPKDISEMIQKYYLDPDKSSLFVR